MLEEFDSPALKAAADAAIEARPARAGDDNSDVLVLGEGFFYIGAMSNGELYKFETPPEGAPTRVVIDADSFLSGLVPTTMTFLAVREPDGLVLKIPAPGLEVGRAE